MMMRGKHMSVRCGFRGRVKGETTRGTHHNDDNIAMQIARSQLLPRHNGRRRGPARAMFMPALGISFSKSLLIARGAIKPSKKIDAG